MMTVEHTRCHAGVDRRVGAALPSPVNGARHEDARSVAAASPDGWMQVRCESPKTPRAGWWVRDRVTVVCSGHLAAAAALVGLEAEVIRSLAAV